MKEVPIREKSNLSLEEAAAYSGIGVNKLHKLTNEKTISLYTYIAKDRILLDIFCCL